GRRVVPDRRERVRAQRLLGHPGELGVVLAVREEHRVAQHDREVEVLELVHPGRRVPDGLDPARVAQERAVVVGGGRVGRAVRGGIGDGGRRPGGGGRCALRGRGCEEQRARGRERDGGRGTPARAAAGRRAGGGSGHGACLSSSSSGGPLYGDSAVSPRPGARGGKVRGGGVVVGPRPRLDGSPRRSLRLAQPLTEPDIRPPTKYLPRTMYTSSVGSDAKSAPAMETP